MVTKTPVKAIRDGPQFFDTSTRARILVCGLISLYESDQMVSGTPLLPVRVRISLKSGFVVGVLESNYDDLVDVLGRRVLASTWCRFNREPATVRIFIVADRIQILTDLPRISSNFARCSRQRRHNPWLHLT